MAILVIGGFLLAWMAFAFWSFKRKLSWIVAIGGGFLLACFGLIIIAYSVAFAEGSLQIPSTFDFAMDQLKFLSFWLGLDLVLFIVYPLLLNFIAKLPLIGAFAGYLIFMPIFHAALMVYGVLKGCGMTENHSIAGAGIFVLIVTFCLAYWVAADNVRTGNYGMS